MLHLVFSGISWMQSVVLFARESETSKGERNGNSLLAHIEKHILNVVSLFQSLNIVF